MIENPESRSLEERAREEFDAKIKSSNSFDELLRHVYFYGPGFDLNLEQIKGIVALSRTVAKTNPKDARELINTLPEEIKEKASELLELEIVSGNK